MTLCELAGLTPAMPNAMRYSKCIGGEALHHPRTEMTSATLQSQLKAARATVNALEFGTDAWEAAMVAVRRLVDQVNAATPAEEFCSIDSGIHRTRLLDGRVI